MSKERTRRQVVIGLAAAAVLPSAFTIVPEFTAPALSQAETSKSRIPPKLQQALDQLSKQPSTLSPELEAYLERTEGWMDRLGEPEPTAVE